MQTLEEQLHTELQLTGCPNGGDTSEIGIGQCAVWIEKLGMVEGIEGICPKLQGGILMQSKELANSYVPIIHSRSGDDIWS